MFSPLTLPWEIHNERKKKKNERKKEIEQPVSVISLKSSVSASFLNNEHFPRLMNITTPILTTIMTITTTTITITVVVVILNIKYNTSN